MHILKFFKFLFCTKIKKVIVDRRTSKIWLHFDLRLVLKASADRINPSTNQGLLTSVIELKLFSRRTKSHCVTTLTSNYSNTEKQGINGRDFLLQKQYENKFVVIVHR